MGGDSRGASKTDVKANAIDQEEQKWTTFKSVLDLFEKDMAKGTKQPSRKPPIEKYVGETIWCLRQGRGDLRTHHAPGNKTPLDGSHHSSAGSTAVAGTQRTQRTEALSELLLRGDGDVARNATQAAAALFWIALGGLIGGFSAPVLEELREQFSAHWFQVTLRMSQVSHRLQDWLMGALPILFAQAFFRILVEAFEEDYKQFVANGEKVVEKLTQLAAFEMSGFQLTPETVRSERRRLLSKTAIECPHLDQEELINSGLLEAAQLKSKLERNGEGPPLVFGADSAALQEPQLEHCLEGWRAGGTACPPSPAHAAPAASLGAASLVQHYADLPRAPPPRPPKAEIDGYEVMAMKGREMHRRFVDEFIEVATRDNGEEEEEAAVVETLVSLDIVQSVIAELSIHRGSSTGSSKEPCSPKCFQKAVLRARGHAWEKETRPEEKGSMEREAAARRARQEALLAHAVAGTLPEEVRQRKLMTTLVSPPIRRLAPKALLVDSRLLRKPACEHFTLQMTSRPLTSSSAPLLEAGKSDFGSPPAVRKPRRPTSASGRMDDGPASSTPEALGDLVRSVTAMRRSSQHQLGGVLQQPVAGSNNLLGAGSKSGAHPAGETISIEAPARLTQKVIVKRLGNHIAAVRDHSFAEYTLQHDAMTGCKAVRFDAERLAREEDAYVQNMRGLVGGAPKRQLLPGVRS